MASSSTDSGGWVNLPREILLLIVPLIYDCSIDIDSSRTRGIPSYNKKMLPVARLVCSHWAYSLPHGIHRIRKYCLQGPGPVDWGTRLLSGLQELKWSAPRSLRCAPWGSLKRLELDNARSTNVALKVLFSCSPPLLTHLDISGSNVTDSGLLGAWPPCLSSLDLSRCSKITDAALNSLGHLTSLRIEDCPRINGSGLGELASVKRLSLSGQVITNWESIKQLRSLEEFSGDIVAPVLLSLVSSLAFVSSLKTLTLVEKSISLVPTHLSMHELRELPFLTHMSLMSFSGITDDGIAQLRSLETLTIVECDNITADGLAPLTRLSNLTLLISNRVGDAGLVELARMRSLTSLHVSGCDAVTEAGLQALRDARPDLLLTV